MESQTIQNQITCIYASGSKFSDQIQAFLASADKATLKIDKCKTMPSDTQWHDIAERLEISLKSLIDTQKLKLFDQTSDFDEESLVKILANHPEALKGAIVMEGERISHILRYTQLLEFYNVDSAGLTKTMHSEEPVTQRQTDGERFL
jgi:arsenate reductase-like glutaredoxin family protein